jgi:signal transduction histidine kinase
MLVSTLAVTTLAVIGFGLPLGLAVQHLYRRDAVYTLVRLATQAGAQVPARIEQGDPIELPSGPHGATVAAYRADGQLLAGRGPARADRTVLTALTGRVVEATDRGGPVVAVPVASNEQIVGVVRAALPASAVDGRIHRAWLAMAAVGAGALAAAGMVAFVLARRLARPITDVADAARRLGQGDFSVTVEADGVAELAEVAHALNTTAARLDQLLARERSFSADASHQLRTPLAGLRLSLETAQLDPTVDRDQAITDALAEVDRLQTTVEDLLALARDRPAAGPPVALDGLLRALQPGWHARLAGQGRRLDVAVPGSLPTVTMSAEALRQILNVLIDNAAAHGRGRVEVSARALGPGVAIEVSDEGPGVSVDGGDIFARRGPGSPGGGIGLALARSLAAAEGGRLELARAQPGATFQLLVSAGGTANGAGRDA